ncbi:MAG TPA: iron-sulfur cluster assembly accessory protein [Firmicutes bacterium]|nr:iron-sulfur cluster assembly accessory protein [Bacillota bacterium]HHY99275.1 iron-sulfur cluster assembly accessory protein [Bacillota bacterium]
MTLDESAKPDDIAYEHSGVKFVMDPRSARYLENATVDYRSGWFGGGFVIKGPNTSTC